MNDEKHNPEISPDLEARIARLVLGEASESESDQLAQLIEARPELAEFKEQIETAHELLREVGRGEWLADNEWRLPAEKRSQLLATIGLANTQQSPKPKILRLIDRGRDAFALAGWSTLTKIAAVVGAVGLIGSLLLINNSHMNQRLASNDRWSRGRTFAVESEALFGYSNSMTGGTASSLAIDSSASTAAPATAGRSAGDFSTESASLSTLAEGISSEPTSPRSFYRKDDVQDYSMKSEEWFGGYPGGPSAPAAATRELGQGLVQNRGLMEQAPGLTSENSTQLQFYDFGLPATPGSGPVVPSEEIDGMGMGMGGMGGGMGGMGMGRGAQMGEAILEDKFIDNMLTVDEAAVPFDDRGSPTESDGRIAGHRLFDRSIETEHLQELKEQFTDSLDIADAGLGRNSSQPARPEALGFIPPPNQTVAGLSIAPVDRWEYEKGAEVEFDSDSDFYGRPEHNQAASEAKNPSGGSKAEIRGEISNGITADRKSGELAEQHFESRFGTAVPQSQSLQSELSRTDGEAAFKNSPSVDDTIDAFDLRVSQTSLPSIVAGATPSREKLNQLGDLAEAKSGKAFDPRMSQPLSKKQSEVEPIARSSQVAPVANLNEVSAAATPFSTFSLHVSDVSFQLAQAALGQGRWPESAKIRIEEFVNALDYGDPLPSQSERVACRVEQAIHPFLQQRNLLRVSMRTAAEGRANDTPLRLTLLLDNSGSMERSDRQQTVRRAFALLAQQLKPIDQVTLISFARQPRLLADQANGSQLQPLIELIDNLPSEGGTNIEAALQLAFEKARQQQVDNAQNRIVLLTDGAVNLGDANPESLSQMITTFRDAGIAFDAAGISADGLNDDVLEALTRQGDGRYYLLDSVASAEDVFARQLAGALHPAAKNVKVQVEFNPERVGHYRLLGFEKHLLKQEDFRNDQVDAAEMAAAEAGVAVYQFEAKPDGEGDVGSISVRFQDLATGRMIENRWPIPYQPDAPRLEQAAPALRIAASAALLAAKLRGEALGAAVELKTLSELMAGLPDRNRTAQRVQQLQRMIEQARQVSGK